MPGLLADAERHRSIDVLRGVAVLGIFVMNIRNFGLPLRSFDNPAFPEAAGTLPGAADLWCWALANVFFEDKMIAIFSMLFGAGVVIMTGRVERPRLVHLRRMLWLFLFGVAHAYLVWYGDILNTYAICGVLIFPARRWRPGVLIGIGTLVFVAAALFRLAPAWRATVTPSTTEAVSTPSASDRILEAAVENEEAAQRSGSYLDLVRWRANLNTFWHFYGCIDFNFWRCGGLMLIGMGLAQLGVLGAGRSSSTYWGLTIAGLTVGLTLVLAGFWPQLARALGRMPTIATEARPMVGLVAYTARYLGAGALAVGYVGAIMLLCRAIGTSMLLTPVAAAGRMALTNYLMQSVIGALVFDGWAGGQWGRWRFHELTMLVVGVWLVQLVLSPMWLRRFRFGPAEWLWRSLTAWTVQPFRR